MRNLPNSSFGRASRCGFYRGFSLIEMAMTLAVIGILAIFATVTFNQLRGDSQDRVAQQALRTTLSAAISVYVGDCPRTTNAQAALCLSEAEPAYEFTAEPSTGPRNVSISLTEAPVATALADSSNCWVITSRGVRPVYGVFVVSPTQPCLALSIDPTSISGSTPDSPSDVSFR